MQPSIPPPPPSAPPLPAHDPEDLFDYARVRDYALLLLSSPARAKGLFWGVFVSVLSVTVAGLFMLPRSYTSETRILTQRAGRYLPGDDAPLRAASEVVLSQANLEALVRETNLLQSYPRTRSPAGRMKDAVMRAILGLHPTDDDLREGLVATLEKRVQVTTPNEGTVAIAVTWQDAETAYRLAVAAQANFLAGKQSTEASAISETIGILQGHADSVRQAVDDQLDRLRAAMARHRPETAKPAARAPARPPAAVAKAVPNARLESLQSMLSAKRADLRQQDAAHARQISDLTAELARLRMLYTPNHPLVIEAQRRLDGAREEPPQLAALRVEIGTLEQAVADEGGSVAPPEGPVHALSLPREVAAASTISDPDVEYEAAQLRLLITKYNNLLERLDSARIDLETTQAAFKQRYTVTHPPQLPQRADNLRPPMVVAAGLAVALALALFASAAMELLRGRIVRRWQVQRQLGLPVLAEIAEP